MGGTEKRRRGTKILKRGVKLGQVVGALKKGGGWNPLMNYVIYIYIYTYIHTIYLYIYLYIYISISIYLYIYLSIYIFIYLYIYLYIYIYINYYLMLLLKVSCLTQSFSQLNKINKCLGKNYNICFLSTWRLLSHFYHI